MDAAGLLQPPGEGSNAIEADRSNSPTPSSHGRTLLMIGVVGVVFVAMVSLIFYHSQWKIFRSGQPASALLVIEGLEEHAGAVVTAESFGVPVARVKLGDDNKHTARLRLTPGEYLVHLEPPGRSQRLLKIGQYKVSEYQYLLIRLPKPATRPG